MLQNILPIINSTILFVFVLFFKEVPKLINDLKLEKIKNQNQSNLQVESYFRQLSGKDIESVFQKWLTLIDDMSNNKLTGNDLNKHVKDLQTKTFMYGSSTTIKIYSSMMQQIYINSSIEKKVNVNFGKKKEKDYSLIIYNAFLVASLKKDFTGYKIAPKDFLEGKITDLNHGDEKEAFKKAENMVIKELLEKGIKMKYE